MHISNYSEKSRIKNFKRGSCFEPHIELYEIMIIILALEKTADHFKPNYVVSHISTFLQKV